MNLGLPEMIFIFLLALIIFGPKKLPEIGRQIGKAMNEFKRASNEFKSQIEGEIRNLELEETVKHETPQILPPQGSVPNTASGAVAAHDPEPAPDAPAFARDAVDGGMNSAATPVDGGMNSAATQTAAPDAPPPTNGAAKDSPEQAKAADV
jgi:TatA/E family protein of Tat protein translocase